MASLRNIIRSVAQPAVKLLSSKEAPSGHRVKFNGSHIPVMTVQKRCYAVDRKDTVSTDDLRDRVMTVLSMYDKIEGQKLTLDSHFENDLGLDSLDHVELIMAMEDEFGFEIPDTIATRLERPIDIVKYVVEKQDTSK